MVCRVDLCHHTNDDDDVDDDGYNPQEALLDKMNKTNPQTNGRRRCCTFRSVQIGSRQKIVILVKKQLSIIDNRFGMLYNQNLTLTNFDQVTVLVFAIMIASSVLIWIGMRNSTIQPAVVAQACNHGSLVFRSSNYLSLHSVISLPVQFSSTCKYRISLLPSCKYNTCKDCPRNFIPFLQVYVDLIAVVVLLLGGALACYGEHLE